MLFMKYIDWFAVAFDVILTAENIVINMNNVDIWMFLKQNS